MQESRKIHLADSGFRKIRPDRDTAPQSCRSCGTLFPRNGSPRWRDSGLRGHSGPHSSAAFRRFRSRRPSRQTLATLARTKRHRSGAACDIASTRMRPGAGLAMKPAPLKIENYGQGCGRSLELRDVDGDKNEEAAVRKEPGRKRPPSSRISGRGPPGEPPDDDGNDGAGRPDCAPASNARDCKCYLRSCPFRLR